MLTADFLRHLLHYNPLTGEWVWINPVARSIRRGDIAGTVRYDGRLQISVGGKVYLAARLAWLYMTGEWPIEEIDHENRIKGDDRWLNLREATHSQNQYNRAWCERRGDLRGIQLDGNQYRVMVGNQYLGYYASLEEAVIARDTALEQFAGPFAINSKR